MASTASRLPPFLTSPPAMLPRPLVEIVERLRAAVGDDAALREACRVFGRTIGAAMIAAHRYDYAASGGSVLVPIDGVDDAACLAYHEHFSKVNVWMLTARDIVRPRSVPVSHLMCPDTVLERSEWHNDFLRRHGVFHSTGCVLAVSGKVTQTVTFLRPRRLGNYTEQEQRQLQLLGPHLETAFRVHERISAARELGSLGLALIDRLADGVVLVGRGGEVTAMNRAAAEIVAARDGLEVVAGRLAATLPVAMSALRSVIRAALGEGVRAGTEASTLIPRRSARLPYQLSAVSLRSVVSWFSEPHAYAAVFVNDPDDGPDSGARRLAEMYHLTQREAELVMLLAAGLKLRSAAERMEVSLNTARTHLTHLFSKTGTARQAELVRLVLPALRRLTSAAPPGTWTLDAAMLRKLH